MVEEITVRGDMTSNDPACAGSEGQPGSVLANRYRLGRRLGRGGMADVFEAVDELLGRSVAIKTFRVDASPDDRRRIELEMQTLAALRHPGLVTVFDAGAVRGDDEASTPFLVMELISGPSLARVLEDGPIDARQTARIGADLARTLTYVHDCNVVHRDVKPANVLLDTHDTAAAPFAAKLADFGISRVMDGARLTTHGTTVGTANYLSPEQAQGQPIGPASDVYSLGLVLCECLTGKLVYPGTGIEAAIARLHTPPAIPSGFGTGWQQLLTAMTSQDPDGRPTTSVIAAALSELASTGSAPDGASPTDATTVLSTVAPASTAVLPAPRRRHAFRLSRAQTALAALVLAAALVVILVTTLSAGGGSSITTRKPTYPAVTGKLGIDLQQLEGAVP